MLRSLKGFHRLLEVHRQGPTIFALQNLAIFQFIGNQCCIAVSSVSWVIPAVVWSGLTLTFLSDLQSYLELSRHRPLSLSSNLRLSDQNFDHEALLGG